MPDEDQNFAHCEMLLREADRDRWLAGLFLPVPARSAVTALYAFNVEVSRVRDLVSQPLPGEVRLQWWRDCLDGEARGDAASHPVAAALLASVARYRLPREALTGIVDARVHDLYDDLFPGVTDLEAYCGATTSVLMRLATLVLADGTEPRSADATGHAGVAYGITTLLRALPHHAARGRVNVPQDILERCGAGAEDFLNARSTPGVSAALAEMRALARRHHERAIGLLGEVAAPARGALLPLSLVPPYLSAMERRGFNPFSHAVELPQWHRQWTLWRASRQWR
jgi:15-cis-phytoene synthase